MNEIKLIGVDLDGTVLNKDKIISHENIDKIFNKFSRVDSPLTRKIQGNGLGLYITKTLVEKMNGKISVESSKDGSNFKIIFKIASPEDNAKKIKE